MIKLGRTEVVTHTFYLDDVPADEGDVTVVVKNDAEETIYSGPAGKNDDLYSFTLPAQSTLGGLTITWTGDTQTDTTTDELIGDYLFETWQLKQLMPLRGSKRPYSATELRNVRDQVTETFESVAHGSFVERRKTVRVPVSAGSAFLPTVGVRQVLTVNGETFTGDFLPYGYVSGLQGTSAVITYDHVLDGGVTAEARKMALDLAASYANAITKSTPDGAEQVTDPNGNTYRLQTIGLRGVEVGVPHVDAFLKRVKFEMPGVA